MKISTVTIYENGKYMLYTILHDGDCKYCTSFEITDKMDRLDCLQKIQASIMDICCHLIGGGNDVKQSKLSEDISEPGSIGVPVDSFEQLHERIVKNVPKVNHLNEAMKIIGSGKVSYREPDNYVQKKNEMFLSLYGGKADIIQKDDCPDCKGTKVYKGLMGDEPCRTCQCPT